MRQIALFTDASLNPQSKIGVGGLLMLDLAQLSSNLIELDKNQIIAQIKFKTFENVSSTKLEMLTALWALTSIKTNILKNEELDIKLFTDSQCTVGLLERRERLERNHYIAQSSGKELNHSHLYKEFFKIQDNLKFEVIKVKGHSKSSSHDSIHRIFSYLDRAVRSELKKMIKDG